MSRPFINAGFIGLIVIFISTLLISLYPQKAEKYPEGFFTPIAAFEFVKTESEVIDLFGREPGEARESLIYKMDFGNRIDFIYMFAYGLFLVVFSYKCFSDTGKKIYLLPAVLTVIAVAADFGENIQLLAITSKITTGGFANELYYLHIFTWIKWGGLAAVFLSMIPFFIDKKLIGRLFIATALINAAIGTTAFFHRSILNEIYIFSVASVFLWMIIFSFIYQVPDED